MGWEGLGGEGRGAGGGGCGGDAGGGGDGGGGVGITGLVLSDLSVSRSVKVWRFCKFVDLACSSGLPSLFVVDTSPVKIRKTHAQKSQQTGRRKQQGPLWNSYKNKHPFENFWQYLCTIKKKILWKIFSCPPTRMSELLFRISTRGRWRESTGLGWLSRFILLGLRLDQGGGLGAQACWFLPDRPIQVFKGINGESRCSHRRRFEFIFRAQPSTASTHLPRELLSEQAPISLLCNKRSTKAIMSNTYSPFTRLWLSLATRPTVVME